MSASSSEEGSGTTSLSVISSGIESTGSLLFSLPSDSSDIPTEITPPTSPAPCKGKVRTPRDILDASRRLGQISLQGDETPARVPKQFHNRTPAKSVVSDETGYDADGDGDGDGDRDGDEGARASAGSTATTRSIHRPQFLRIDTRQHRRVASMLATRRTSPGFGVVVNKNRNRDVSHHLRAKLAPLTPVSLKPATAGPKAECYELQRRPRVEPVGLGIGFPENHPLRNRAFTVPVVSPSADPLPEATKETHEERFDWLPSPIKWKKSTQVPVCAPSPVRLTLRPTFLEVSPSPIECLLGGGAGTPRRDGDAHELSEISKHDPDPEDRRIRGIFGHEIEVERKRRNRVSKGQINLFESEMSVGASRPWGVTVATDSDVGAHPGGAGM